NVFENFKRIFYRQEDLQELHLSIRKGILERYETPFFTALTEYSQRPTGVFHAMPISRGNSIFNSHWIRDMSDFYGRNIFLAETSATTGGLDSLLQPTGPLKKAQELAAKAFGSQHTYFVTNGTSTANKIVQQALVQPGDIVLIDRDCHKSHHYALVLAGAFPVYLDSYPIQEYSIYGAVPLEEIKNKLFDLKKAGRLNKVKMLVLTNCTFDGLVYNVEKVMKEILAIKPDIIFLWDEAWFGFASFTSVYRQRTAMCVASKLYAFYKSDEYRKKYIEYKKDKNGSDSLPEIPDPDKVKIRVYSTQSTHKTLSSLRQGSMIHIFDEDFRKKVEDTFHEAYMTHISTSANYQILASLDVGRRQTAFEAYELVEKSIEMAMILREKITTHPRLNKYFHVLTIKDIIPENHRESGIAQYYDTDNGWSRMEDAWVNDEFVLDPTKVTLFIGNTGVDGDTFKNRFLMDQFGIQINKTSRNTVLFMTNIGTRRSSVAYLIGVLLKIAKQIEETNESLNNEEADLQKKLIHSLNYENPPLPDFSRFHYAFRPNKDTSEGDIRSAFFLAYNEEICEYVKLKDCYEVMDSGREIVSASFVIPYPPGFPVLIPGQVFSKEIIDFMNALDVKEIHGYRAELGFRVFSEEAIKSIESKQIAKKITANISNIEISPSNGGGQNSEKQKEKIIN
ncbi:MAG: aminotransferase class I/II-fold pyridoxal phosphate-dependent enzyme, partial [Ignavibacteriaceae bacterium]